AFALYIIAHMRGMSGDIEAAQVALVAGDDIMLDLGLDFALMESAVAHQIVAMLGGDLPEAESLLRRIYDPGRPNTLEANSEEGVAIASSLLALNLFDQGRFEEAARGAREAAEVEREFLWPRFTWTSVLAGSLARLGMTEQAVPLAYRAAALVAES